MSALGLTCLRQQTLRTNRASTTRPLLIIAHLRHPEQPTKNVVRSIVSHRLQTVPRVQPGRKRPRVTGRQLVVRAVAMVNVDFASPSLILGLVLIGCGVLLLNLRQFQNKVSRDADIVVAAMVSIVGSTLIFQGWRLDPLLLLCQALTTSVAFWYGLETFRLRSKEPDMVPPPQLPPGVAPEAASLDPAMQQYYQQQQQLQQQMGFPPAGMPYLPPGSESYYPWGSAAADAQAASSSGRAGVPYGGAGTNPYAETIQYDYYGNPILPQEQTTSYNGAGYGAYGAAYGETAGVPYAAPPSPEGFGYGQTVGGGPPPPPPPPPPPGTPAAGPAYDPRVVPPTVGTSYGGYDVSYSMGAGQQPATGPVPPMTPPPPFGAPAAAAAAAARPQQAAAAGASFALPSVSTSGGGAGGTAGRPSAAEGLPGLGLGPAAGLPYSGSGSPAWGSAGAAAAAGPAAGAGPGGQQGRLEFHEKVDDWE